MDSYQHVRKGVQYPAVLATTGLNDPRVAPWQPAKLVAQLQDSGTSRPVLLRVQAQGGHGAAATNSQEDEEFADYAAFILWRSGACRLAALKAMTPRRLHFVRRRGQSEAHGAH